jgi:4-oxalocrotonate tautomerase
MPIIRVEMLHGRSVEQKREVAEVFTRELARICHCAPEGVVIVIDEVKKENWSVGGQLFTDKYPDKK